MTRRRALWLLGLVTVALFAVLAVLDRRMMDAGSHGIVDFELAFSEQRAGEILSVWGTEGRDAARLSLWLDFPFLIAYGLFLRLAVLALRDALLHRDRERLARPAVAIAVLPLVAAGADAVEDVFLLLVLGGRADTLGPPLAGAFATVKFLCMVATVLYLLAGLATVVRARRRLRPR